MGGDIRLSKQFETITRRQMETGRYGSASEVVAVGLTLLAGFERRVLSVFEVGADTVRIGRIPYGGRDYQRLLDSLPR